MCYSESDILKEIVTPTVRLRLLQNDMIHYTFLPGAELTLNDAIENHNAFLEIRTGLHGLIIDSMEDFMNPTKEYSDFIRAKEATTPLLGRAVVTKSLGHKLLVSLHLKVSESRYPIKVFQSHSKAMQWLLSLKK